MIKVDTKFVICTISMFSPVLVYIIQVLALKSITSHTHIFLSPCVFSCVFSKI